MQFASWSLSFN